MKARALHSTLTTDSTIRLTLDDVDLGAPGPDEVIVRVDATPVNPTDIALMLSGADLAKATASTNTVVAPVSSIVLQIFGGRIDKPLPIGTEGSGTVVEAGSSPAAQALLGKLVATSGGMFATHRKFPAAAVRELPPGATAEDGASSFVNPMTALSFVETMRAEGHKAIVHTAAASNLGQMLVKICKADGVPLVNIVRKPAHVEQLSALGAQYVLDSTSSSFATDLVNAIGETGATIAFDAIGGGSLGGRILDAMERVAARSMTTFSHYGSSTMKQLYIYGSLDRSPTTLSRTFGLTWSVGGYLVMNAMRKLGPEAVGRMFKRVASELKTTFASHYSSRITLDQLLDLETLRACAQMQTGEKYLIVSAR
ncbi:MAG TPA: zinc-binding dehydrogenase [Kofleriaceae bacterium]|nr:zinc-binding dehydrogenase [Kofleriaceae bacterium]